MEKRRPGLVILLSPGLRVHSQTVLVLPVLHLPRSLEVYLPLLRELLPPAIAYLAEELRRDAS
ncbi:MAG: hypothetical protein RXR41_01240 [Candidatus Marsarchaeota archaeon]